MNNGESVNHTSSTAFAAGVFRYPRPLCACGAIWVCVRDGNGWILCWSHHGTTLDQEPASTKNVLCLLESLAVGAWFRTRDFARSAAPLTQLLEFGMPSAATLLVTSRTIHAWA